MSFTFSGSCGVVVVSLLSLLASPVFAASQAEVDRLARQCESAREKTLVPVRAEKIRVCIDQKERAPDHCERYYQTYGNTSMVGSRRVEGMFYDLPECQAYLEAQETLQGGRSRDPS
jgi:hypothetical protein